MNGIIRYIIMPVIMVCMCSLLAFGEAYKWIDEDGVMHFSDQPPNDSKQKYNIYQKDNRFDENNLLLSKSLWNISGPIVEIDEDILRLHSISPTYPYLYSKSNLFRSYKYFRVYVKFRYVNVTGWGTGLFITNFEVKPESYPGELKNIDIVGNSILGLWQDSTNGFNVVCMGKSVFHKNYTDVEPHEIELRYDGIYKVYVDGELKYKSAATQNRPTFIGVGNPFDLNSQGEWTSIEIQKFNIDKYIME